MHLVECEACQLTTPYLSRVSHDLDHGSNDGLSSRWLALCQIGYRRSIQGEHFEIFHQVTLLIDHLGKLVFP
jgi:hypothetical protein